MREMDYVMYVLARIMRGPDSGNDSLKCLFTYLARAATVRDGAVMPGAKVVLEMMLNPERVAIEIAHAVLRASRIDHHYAMSALNAMVELRDTVCDGLKQRGDNGLGTYLKCIDAFNIIADLADRIAYITSLLDRSGYITDPEAFVAAMDGLAHNIQSYIDAWMEAAKIVLYMMPDTGGGEE